MRAVLDEEGDAASRLDAPRIDTWVLTGRDAELDRVVTLLAGRSRRRGAGPAGAVLVGEAGSGKTRLVAEALDRLDVGSSGGPTVVRVLATRSGQAIPLGALVPFLPRTLDAPGDEGNIDDADVGADHLRAAADALAALGSGDGRSDGPLVLAVDDAHWLDEASATVVLHLVLAGRARLIATVRSGEPAPEPVTALWKDDLVERIDVGNLAEPDLGVLLEQVLGGSLDRASLHALYTASRGNPLFVRELVYGSLSSGALAEQDGLWRLREGVGTTPRLVELIAHRLGALTDPEQDVLALLAIGESLGPHHLASGLPAGAAVGDVLLGLERRGLVEVAMERRRVVVRFAHPLYGEVVRSQLPTLRAMELNRRLAESVEATGARRREDVLRVGLWRLDGGGHVDVDLMVEAARRALFANERDLAGRLADAAFTEAVASGDGAREAGLLLAEVRRGQGRNAEADEVLLSLATGSEVTEELAPTIIARASNLFWGLGQDAEALDLLEACEAGLPAGPLRDEARAVRATIVMLTGRFREARALVAPILADATGRVLINASIAEAGSLAVAGRGDEAEAVALRALAAHAELGDQQLLARPWIHENAMTLAASESGRLAHAREVAGRGHAAAIERGEKAAQAWFGSAVARSALLTGRPRTAARRFRESAVLHDEVGEPGPRRWSLAGVVISAALVGDRPEVDRAFQTLRAIDSPMRMMESDVTRAEAWWQHEHGDLEGARVTVRAAVASAAERGADALAAVAAWDLARFGDTRGAAELLEPLRGASPLNGLRADHAAAAVARDAAALVEVADRFDEWGYELEAAEAASLAAECLLRDGAPRESAAVARRVEAFRTRGEGVFTRLLSSSSVAAPLTDRQRDIALLAAQGLPSKVIAERLNLSRRTVDNNLHQAFQRLGISRRADLAEALGATDDQA